MDKEEIVYLDIDKLQPNPLQPRGVITPESLVDLVDSIREHGILEPLLVAETPAGLQIIAGERRWRAAKIAGLKKVPAVIRKTTPRGMLEMALVENVQREDLNPLERARAFQRLVTEFGLTPAEIGRKIGKSPDYVANSIALLKLPDLLKDALLSGLTTEGHVRNLGRLKKPKLILEAYKEVLKKKLSVRGTEELVRRIQARERLKGRLEGKPRAFALILSPKLKKIEKELEGIFGKFGRQLQIRVSQSQVQARILIVLKGRPERTNGALELFYKKLTGKSLRG